MPTPERPENKKDLFDATGSLRGGYDIADARANALAHAKKTHGEYVGRGKQRRPLLWNVDRAAWDEDADCFCIVLSAYPDGAEVHQKGVWEYHARVDGTLLPGTPILRQTMRYALPSATRRGHRWLAVGGGVGFLAVIAVLVASFWPLPPVPNPSVRTPTPTLVPSAGPTPRPTPRVPPSPIPTPTLAPTRTPTTKPNPTTTPTPVRIPTPVPTRTLGPPSVAGRIAFVSLRDGNAEIYVMNPDGTDVRRLTNDAAEDSSPAWSPDGNLIAFKSTRSRGGELFVMGADGKSLRAVTNQPAHEDYPAWSADGRRIAFYRRDNQTGERGVYTLDATGRDLQRLLLRTQMNSYDEYFRLSPDWALVAFSAYEDGGSEIHVMKVDGTSDRRLTHNRNAHDNFPTWSPDGKYLAFASKRDGNWEVYMISADGTNERRLTDDPAEDTVPTWSPDGKLIAFTSNRDGNYEIYVMNADGTNQRNLTNNRADDALPAWGP